MTEPDRSCNILFVANNTKKLVLIMTDNFAKLLIISFFQLWAHECLLHYQCKCDTLVIGKLIGTRWEN